MTDFLSNNSENVISSTPFEFDLDTAAGDPELDDPVGDSLYRTRIGLSDLRGPALQEYIRRLAARIIATNVARERVAEMARKAVGGPVPGRPREPYEFRFFPVTGANHEDIPRRGLLLPLPPEKFDVDRSVEPRTFVSINQKEFSLPGSNSLATLTLEGMFPNVDPMVWTTRGRHGRQIHWPAYLPRYVTAREYRTPKELATTFTNLMVKAQPLELFIGPRDGQSLDVGGLIGKAGRMHVTVTSFVYGEAFGHPGSYVFSMTLKQWRRIYPKPSVAPKPPTGSTPPPPLNNTQPASPPKPRVYTVRSGDTLWDIAARFLGSGTEWPRIYNLNKKTIEDECKRRKVSCYPKGWHIWPGTKLMIPQKGRHAS